MPEHATGPGETHSGQRQNAGILVAFKVRLCIWTVFPLLRDCENEIDDGNAKYAKKESQFQR